MVLRDFISRNRRELKGQMLTQASSSACSRLRSQSRSMPRLTLSLMRAVKPCLPFLFVSRRSLLAIPSFGEQGACKQGQASPYSELPPKLFPFGGLKVESVPHGFAGRLRFRDRPVIIALSLRGEGAVIRGAGRVVGRGADHPGTGVFLRDEGSLNLHLCHGVCCGPLQRRSDSHGSQANPAGQHGVSQESMQIHSLRL